MKLEPCVDCEYWDEELQRCGKEKMAPELTNCIRIRSLEEYCKNHKVTS